MGHVRRPQRYACFAPAYDVLSGEWPVYHAGRVAVISGLRLRPGALVLDIGCGTGLNFSLLRQAVGNTGRIVGVDLSTDMLAQARAKASHRGWENIDLVCADATTLTPAQLGGRQDQFGGAGADAVLFTYSLSLMPAWPQAWAAATAVARPGARVAVVDLAAPTGLARAFAPLALLACAVGGSDITAHPWTALERDCIDIQARSLRGGHIQVRAGTLPPGPTNGG